MSLQKCLVLKVTEKKEKWNPKGLNDPVVALHPYWAYPKENTHTYFNRTKGGTKTQLFTFLHVEYLALLLCASFCELLLQLFFKLTSSVASLSNVDSQALWCELVRLYSLYNPLNTLFIDCFLGIVFVLVCLKSAYLGHKLQKWFPPGMRVGMFLGAN